jgi:hypothetical protein
MTFFVKTIVIVNFSLSDYPLRNDCKIKIPIYKNVIN